MRHRLEWLLFRLVLASLRWTPLAVASCLGRFYLGLIYLAARRARQVAMRNLAMAGFPHRQRIVRGVFRSMARLLVVFARFPRLDRRNIPAFARYEGLPHYEAARKRGRGVLVATAHLGNWELCAFAHALLGAPIHLVARSLENPWIDEIVGRYRALAGNRVHAKKGAVRHILPALRSGETVALLIDENSAPGEGVFIDFFGVKACAGTALARMAHHSGAAVVPAWAIWSGAERRYILHVEPEVEMTGDAAADTQRIHARIEAAIRRDPEQWLWTSRRWKTRPPGEQPSVPNKI